MCLAIPGQLIEITEENGLRMGRVDFAGTIGTACLEYVPEAEIGKYVIVHAGFAISVLDEDEAVKTLALWREMLAAEESERPIGTDGEE